MLYGIYFVYCHLNREIMKHKNKVRLTLTVVYAAFLFLLFNCTPEDEYGCGCIKTTYVEANKVNIPPYIPYDVVSKEVVPCQPDAIKRIDDESYYTILCD